MTIQAPLSEVDLKLLGYTSVDSDPRFRDDDPAIVFRATAMAGLQSVTSIFVYLKSRATRSQADEILRKLPKDQHLVVVVPQSTLSRSEIINLCRARGVPCHVHEELMWERIWALLGEYVTSLSEGIVTEKYFVQPRREGDARTELDRELKDHLSGRSKANPGTILVLSAPAGVGKTTLARHLTLALAKDAQVNKVIPVFVEAQHWSRLQIDAMDGLWDIISNSLRMYGTGGQVNQQLFFDYMLKNGFITFVFDGLDELCGHRQFAFRADDILKELAASVRESEARILITTRTAYWESEIPNPPENVKIVSLASFNTQQAKGYFAKFFVEDRNKRDNALALYQEIQRHIIPPTVDGGKESRAQFVNLPLCVSMVAECVKAGATSYSSFQFNNGVVRGFLRQICEREQERQQLRSSQDEQLLAFEEITMEHLNRPIVEFREDFLELVGIDRLDIPKMLSHPLLQMGGDRSLRFAYDFLPHYFKACSVASMVEGRIEGIPGRLLQLMAAEANGKGFLFEHIVDICGPDEDKIKKGVCRLYKMLPHKSRDERSFVFHLAHTFAKANPLCRTRKERTDFAFRAIFGDHYSKLHEVAGLVLVGKLEGLDLSGIKFRNCEFADLSFIDCNVNRNTEFVECAFSGGLDFMQCSVDEWGQVVMNTTCVMRSPTNLIWEKFIGLLIRPKEEHIKDALRLALSKFWKNGRLKGSLRKDNWTTGSLGHSIYSEPILRAMIKVGLISEGHISGVVEGGLMFDRSALSDIQRFMDGRQLTGKVKEVFNLVISQK